MSALDHPGIRKVAAALSEAVHHEAADGIRVPDELTGAERIERATAGHPHAVCPTTFAGPVDLTGGAPAEVAR